jgi:glucuronoarabinoxylan endo-1,4-beta-xylanase
MFQRMVLCFFVLIGFTANIQTVSAAVSGKVSNQAGAAIANAILSYANAAGKDTTGTDGLYTLPAPTSVTEFPLLKPQSTTITLHRDFLDFSILTPSPVKFEIFDVNGTLLKKELLQNAQAGFYRYNIAEISHTAKLLVIRASIGQDKMMFRYVPLNSGKYSVNSSAQNSVPASGRLAKITVISDTIKVTANGYKAKAVAITSYDNSAQNITLDTAGISDDVVTVNLDQERQTIQGFGINGALMTGSLPWDELFKLEGTDALGLTILRIGMNTDGTLRSVPTDFEKARTNGAKIIGSCWSAPAGWKDNNNENQGGHLLASHYADWATRIAEFAKKYNLYAMSVANESDFASCHSKGPPCTDDYASMVYTAKEMVAFVKEARKAFKTKAPDVKIIAPEASEWIHAWSNLSATGSTVSSHPQSSDPLGCGCFSNDPNDATELAKCLQKCTNGDGYDYGHWLAKDTAAWNAFDIMGVHEYDSQKAFPWPADVTGGVRTKEVWQTEMSGVMYWPEQGPNITIENGVAVARWIQSALTVGEASAWCWWWYGAPYYTSDDNEGLALIKNNSKKAKRYYAMGNYSRYIRPGHKIVNITGTQKLPAKVLLTASKDAAGKVVIVAVNETTSDQSIDITISGGTAPASFTPIVTDKDNNWKEGTAVSVSSGVLKAALGKMSVTTFVSK